MNEPIEKTVVVLAPDEGQWHVWKTAMFTIADLEGRSGTYDYHNSRAHMLIECTEYIFISARAPELNRLRGIWYHEVVVLSNCTRKFSEQVWAEIMARREPKT